MTKGRETGWPCDSHRPDEGSPGLRVLFCADSHLGFDEPVRPRIERRRRSPDFFANFQRVLDLALGRSVAGRECGRVDLLIHGGDLFFRSRVPARIVDRVYGMLVDFVEQGIPILIVPGNHERSILPSSLFLSHPRIHVFTRPETKVFELRGGTLACAGFPCVRSGIDAACRSLIERTGFCSTVRSSFTAGSLEIAAGVSTRFHDGGRSRPPRRCMAPTVSLDVRLVYAGGVAKSFGAARAPGFECRTATA